ncbi:hypothetical protein C8R45DRAFT_615201 [Mycena sanguinolenta]|nr:hypothetical protein C8R45DRAFT_615201 [Mycena sanguinolenta]
MPLSASLSRSAPRRNSAPTAAKIQSTAGKRTAATDSDDDSEDPPLKKPRNSSNDALRRGTLPTPRSLNAASNRSANDSNSNISPANKTSFFFANFNRTPTSSGGAKRYYVGKDPSNFSRPPTSDSSKATSPKKASARPVAHSDDSDTDDPLGSGPPTGKSGQGSSQKSLRASQGTPSQPTNNPSATQTRPTLTGWPIWCVWCQLDTPPAVSEPYTVELRQLFPAPSDVPRVLAAIGILHDMHLRAFALRSKAERNAFLRSFIGSQYDQLKALQISKTLDQYAAEHAHQELPRWDMEACSYHQREHQVCTPPSLSKILHDLGMEELGPAAVFLGCRSEEQFQEARKFDEATKKEFLLDNVQIIKPSPFQKLMLQIALKPKV